DGRDIGTVICPDADAKLFVTASAECRAARRYEELINRDMPVPFEQVLADVKARDERDRSRAASPLVPAADATLLDTSDLTAAQAIAKAISMVAAKRG
ncbi:MAG: (d)CMP kinase, partial [Pseudomonadota bacterium]